MPFSNAKTPNEIKRKTEEKFDLYLEELLYWNKKFNLTAITDPEEIKIKHFSDSLAIFKILPIKDEKIIDIGTGAGFPGIPIKIDRPETDLYLVESKKKKAEFLGNVVKKLDLKKTSIVCGRIEEVARKFLSFFDIAVSRQVSPLPILLEYSMPVLRTGGVLVAYKGENVYEEVDLAQNALEILGGKVEKIEEIEVSKDHKRTLVLVRKVKETPIKYPRRAGIPKKRPL
jgi:16S rRNA (guanine527-N7)-methyltransferase